MNDPRSPFLEPMASFGYLLKDANRLHVRNFERHAAELGLTMQQCRVLGTIARHEGSTQVQVAELVESDPMTMVRVLDRMERDGWIERRIDAGDRRVRRLYLTPAALPVLTTIYDVANLVREEALAGLGATEQQQLIAMLKHIHANLSSLPDTVPPQPDVKDASVSASPRRQKQGSV